MRSRPTSISSLNAKSEVTRWEANRLLQLVPPSAVPIRSGLVAIVRMETSAAIQAHFQILHCRFPLRFLAESIIGCGRSSRDFENRNLIADRIAGPERNVVNCLPSGCGLANAPEEAVVARSAIANHEGGAIEMTIPSVRQMRSKAPRQWVATRASEYCEAGRISGISRRSNCVGWGRPGAVGNLLFPALAGATCAPN